MDAILQSIKDLILFLPREIINLLDPWNLLIKLLTSLLGDMVNNWVVAMQTVVGDIVNTAFYIEKMPGLNSNMLNATTVENAISALYFTCVGLLTLKLLWKGWKVYVLWRNGDSEVSPFSMLLSAIFAIGVAIAFPLLYAIAAEIVTVLSKNILTALPGMTDANILSLLFASFSPWIGSQVAVFNILLALIFVILCIILIFQMLGRGVEMLIFRLGIPFAVVGLIDSDDGIWRNYIQLFFRQLATILIQNFCLRLAIGLAVSSWAPTLLVGIMLLITAFKMPKILSSVLVAGGGNGAGTIQTVTMAARMFIGGA